jgi:hypothetical protein
MNTSTILYTIHSDDHPHCDSPMVFAFVPREGAEKIAANFAAELQFVTRLDPEQIKVWVE